MVTNITQAWWVLVRSLFLRLDTLAICAVMLILGIALLLVVQSVRFSEEQLINGLKAIYPEEYIQSRSEPEVSGFHFERHLLALNEDLSLRLPGNDGQNFILPDVRVRTASEASPAVGIYPGRNEILVTRPIYLRLQEMISERPLSVVSATRAGPALTLQVRMLPLVTSERWVVLHPEAAASLTAFGRARMQTWIPVSAEVNTDVAASLSKAGMEVQTWQELLPLENRLLHSLIQNYAPLVSFFLGALALVFILVFSQALVDQIKQWMRFAAYHLLQVTYVVGLVTTSFSLLGIFIFWLAVFLQHQLSRMLSSFIDPIHQPLWHSTLPSYGDVIYVLPAWLLIYGLIYYSWRSPDLGYWERVQ